MLTKKHQRTLSLSILIAVGLYSFIILSADTGKILATMKQLTPVDWLTVLSCSFISYIFRFIRWNNYIRVFQHFIPLKRHFAYYLAGLALTTTPAKAGETVRSLYLIPYQVKISQSLACFFTERLLDVTIMVFIASFLFFTFPDLDKRYAYFILTLALGLLVLLPLLRTQLLLNILKFMISKSNKNKFSQTIEHLIALLQSAYKLLSIKMISQGLFLGLIAWVLNGLVFYLILEQTGFTVELSLALTIYAISILAGAASFIPGGIGATEAVMGLMLISINSEPHIAIAVPILTRLATLWFAVCVGLLANIYLSLNHIQRD
ncbi:MAG: flippase-like domain-containing protein [Gammaproteobacteria bacterium]|nr:flippase-like domain-containing protein [Gammaproteobacteria bacterium]MCW8988168.1 flippase-like domain-containing protein [Gammaproteobacteria bacterium]